ncbi:MAG: hypothetical protein ACLTER_18380 [Ruminococcus sp.]
MKRAGRFHFDTERIFAVGDSAGAHSSGTLCSNLHESGICCQI